MRVYKRELKNKKISYRKGLIPLTYSDHAKERLKERVNGELIVAPTVLRVTDQNIFSGELYKNSTKLKEVCVKLDYKHDKWMFIVVVLNNGVVKTIWINDKKRKIREKVGSIQEDLEREETYKPTKWQTYLWRIEEFLYGSLIRKIYISCLRIHRMEYYNSNSGRT